MKTWIHLEGSDWQMTRSPEDLPQPRWEDALPAAVPGNIVMDLYQAGVVPDPYYGENFRGLEWVENWTFWYRKQFFVPSAAEECPNRYILRFEGIDTFSEIELNGEVIGKTHNMFKRHIFDVNSTIRPGEMNELVVKLPSIKKSMAEWTEEMGADMQNIGSCAFGYKERVITRKAQMSFGWDQTPRILAGGLFRPVVLEIIQDPSLDEWAWDVPLIDVASGTAQLNMTGKVQGMEDGYVVIQGSCGESGFSCTAPVRGGHWKAEIRIEGAKFWWPALIGDPNMYDVEVLLQDASGRPLDKTDTRIGLRNIQIRTTPAIRKMVDYRIGRPNRDTVMDEGAGAGAWSRVPLEKPEEVLVTPFIATVNGRELFLRGYDWQNPEIFFGCEETEKIRTLLDHVIYSNACILRLWGGATVETDDFYRLCSEKGILVWQDFYFASALYPVDIPGLQEEIRGEVRDIIFRLRNHTCLGLWCGDNESDMVYYDHGMDLHKNVFNKLIIPEALRELDLQERYYHPSSPCGGPYPRSDWGGDKRNWGACKPEGNYWHIRQENARIISEGGYYVLPPVESIRKFLPERAMLPLDSITWSLHNGSVDNTLDQRNFAKGLKHCINYFDSCDSIEKAVEISQFAHAWGTKLLAERCRQRMFDCGGVLLWKITASWPCADGMAVDYYLRPLPSLEYMREAYKPVSVSITQPFDDPQADLEIYVCSDRLGETEGVLEVTAVAMDGMPWEPGRVYFRTSQPYIAAGNSSQVAARIPVQGMNPSSTVICAVFQHVASQEPARGLFTLEPRVAYRTLQKYEYSQIALCDALLNHQVLPGS